MDVSFITWAFVTGVVSALATGLGAPLVAVLPLDSKLVRSATSAVAAGMMISASVFSLAQEGINMEETVQWATPKVIVGMLLGTGFLWFVSDLLEQQEQEDQPFQELQLDTASLLMFTALLIHSSPEGIAIGVGFATEDLQFGVLMATAISIHNIPEGIAMSLAMRTNGTSSGASVWKCAGISVLTSVPQPLLAVPSVMAFSYFHPWLPLGLGFAAGAMIYVTIVELIPDSLEYGSEELAAWGVMVGLVLMLTLTVILPGG